MVTALERIGASCVVAESHKTYRPSGLQDSAAPHVVPSKEALERQRAFIRVLIAAWLSSPVRLHPAIFCCYE
jgi:hypothetical protein